jgi:peptide/nickel transport system permease protein
MKALLFSHAFFFRLKRRGSKKAPRSVFTAPLAASGTLLLLIISCCFLSPLIAPHSETAQDLSASLAPPSAEHLLGADKMGRDLFSRLLYGGRVTIMSALAVALLSFVIGAPLGLFLIPAVST